MTTIQKDILTKEAIELVRRFSSHEWINADSKHYRRLMRTDDGWILIRSSGEVDSLMFAGQVTRAVPEASAVEGLMFSSAAVLL